MRPSVFEMAKLRMFSPSEMTAGHACRINALKCCFSNSIQFTTALLLPSIYNAFQNIDSRQTTSTVLKKKKICLHLSGHLGFWISVQMWENTFREKNVSDQM